VLFMSGYTGNALAACEGMRLMAKPFSGPVLTRAVRDALDDAQETEGAASTQTSA